jgi:hypothetical protein
MAGRRREVTRMVTGLRGVTRVLFDDERRVAHPGVLRPVVLAERLLIGY